MLHTIIIPPFNLSFVKQVLFFNFLQFKNINLKLFLKTNSQ